MKNNKNQNLILDTSKSSDWSKGAKERRSKPWQRDSIKIALLILQEMRELGISKAEFSKKLGVTPQYLGRILKGEENFTLETIWKLKLVLKIDIIEVCKKKTINTQQPTYLIHMNTITRKTFFDKQSIDYSSKPLTSQKLHLEYDC